MWKTFAEVKLIESEDVYGREVPVAYYSVKVLMLWQSFGAAAEEGAS